jgi:hypothetical protein
MEHGQQGIGLGGDRTGTVVSADPLLKGRGVTGSYGHRSVC